MPNFTQNAIKASFLKLLGQRPLNQITVKDIVEDCGVNRNSFYYHFDNTIIMIIKSQEKSHPSQRTDGKFLFHFRWRDYNANRMQLSPRC